MDKPFKALASGAQLVFAPGSATPGSSFVASISGFKPSESVDLYWNGSLVRTFTAAGDGTFSLPLQLSSTAPAGPRSVVARGDAGDSAGATFTVLSSSNGSPTKTPASPTATRPTATVTLPTATSAALSATPTRATSPTTGPARIARLLLSPEAATPGSPITIGGSGFQIGETVNIYWKSMYLASETVQPDGTFSHDAYISPSAPAGSRAVMVTGSSGDQVSGTFTVLSSANTSPTVTSLTATSTPPLPSPTATQTPVPLATQTSTPPTAPGASGIPTSGTTWFGCTITPEQAADEQHLFTLLNQHRADAGSPPLTLDETLSVASRGHSCDMFVHEHADHMGSDGSSPYDRIHSVGITYSTAGENIGMAGGYSSIGGIDAVDNSMMAEALPPQDCASSPPGCFSNHHTNIVNHAYKHVGIGVIYANNQVWLTEDFTG